MAFCSVAENYPSRIKRFRRCKIIVRAMASETTDVDAATEAGIIVGHVPKHV
jgi:lactate dehydrogenase-like 2-hydroxyacid dehydrogenase